MRIKTYLSNIEQLTVINKTLLIGILSMFIANILLSGLVVLAWRHHTTIIVPAEIKQPFTVSSHRMDAAYLEQMALFFIAARLNVTPETVKPQDQLILEYTDSRSYAAVNRILNEEANVIQKDNMSSVFILSELPKVDTQHGLVQMTGILKKWVGDRALPENHKMYQIHFANQGGQLRILSVSEKNNQN